MDKGQGTRFIIQLYENSGTSLEELRLYLGQWGDKASQSGHMLEQVVAIDEQGNIVILWP